MGCSGFCTSLHDAGPDDFPCLGSYVSLMEGVVAMVMFVYVLKKMFKNNRRAIAGYTKNTVSIDVHMTLLTGVAIWAVVWTAYNIFEVDNSRGDCASNDDDAYHTRMRNRSVAFLSHSLTYGGSAFLETLILLLLVSRSIGYNAFRMAWVVAGTWAGIVVIVITSVVLLNPGQHEIYLPYTNLVWVLIARDIWTVLVCIAAYFYHRRYTPDRIAVRRYVYYMVGLSTLFGVARALQLSGAACDIGICLKDVAQFLYLASYAPVVYLVLKRDCQYWTSDIPDDVDGNYMDAFADEITRTEVPNYSDVVIPKSELYYRHQIEERVDIGVEIHLWRRQLVCMKRFKFDILTRDNIKFFKQEANIFRQLRHENIVRFYGVVIDPPGMGIVMEFCPNGDLFKFLEKTRRDRDDRGSMFKSLRAQDPNKTKSIAMRSTNRAAAPKDESPITTPLMPNSSPTRRATAESSKGSNSSIFSRFSLMGSNPALDVGFDPMKAAVDIAHGMAYLNSKACVHYDLKSLNVLLDNAWNAKITDFGETVVKTTRARSFDGDAQNRAQLGTAGWAAPELVLAQASDQSADVFSFGVVLWELMTWLPPSVIATRQALSNARIDPSAHGVYPVTKEGLPLAKQTTPRGSQARPESQGAAAFIGSSPETDTFYLVEVSDMRRALELMVRESLRPPIPHDVPPGMAELMKNCWAADPKLRPSFAEIVAELEQVYKSGILPIELFPLSFYPISISR